MLSKPMDSFKRSFSSAFYFKDGLCYLEILYFNLRVSSHNSA